MPASPVPSTAAAIGAAAKVGLCRLLAAAASAAMLAASAQAQPNCTASWSDQFALAGSTANISEAIVFDDGTGPALYAVGSFPFKQIGNIELTYISTADPVTVSAAYNVAKWDGYRWNIVGPTAITEQDPINSLSRINAIEVFDFDGDGPAPASLIIAGLANTAPTIQSPNTALIWNGSTWAPFGPSLGLTGGTEIYDLQIYNGDLYACGRFSGIGINHIARWSQEFLTWTDVAGSISSVVANIRAERMAVGDADGDGTPELYVAGTFDSVGGVSARRLAKWNGTAWSAVPGFTNTSTTVSSSAGAPTALNYLDTGSGPALVVGDAIYTGLSGSALTRGVVLAQLNNNVWSTLIPQTTSGNKGIAYSAVVYPGPSGQQLHVGGYRLLNGVAGQPAEVGIARRSAAGTFSPLVTPIANASQGGVRWMLPVDWDLAGPGGTKLLFGATAYRGLTLGSFGGLAPLNFALWNGTSIEVPHTGSDALGITNQGTAAPVFIKELDPDGAGPLATGLYVGHSSFNIAGRVTSSGILRFDGTSYFDLPTGVSKVSAFTTFTAGRQTNIYAAGYRSDNSNLDPIIARFNGTTWDFIGLAPLPPIDTPTTIDSLESATVAGEPSLVAAGRFDEMSGVLTNFVARYNGTNWIAMDAGLPRTDEPAGLFLGRNTAMAPKLAVLNGEIYLLLSSYFYSNAISGNLPVVTTLYRWNGSSWINVYDLSAAGIVSMEIIDLGTGPKLYLFGKFENLGGVTGLNGMAIWNGSAFEIVGPGITFTAPSATASNISYMGAHDFGSGRRLVAVGGASPYRGLFKLENNTWQPIAGGGSITGATSICSSTNPAWGGLYIGGIFRVVGGTAVNVGTIESQGIARLITTCTCRADFDNSGTRTIDDIFIFLNAWFNNDPRTDVDGVPGVSIDDIFVFINIWFAGC